MTYEIVEFRNKKFGIRRRSFFENLFNFGGLYFDFVRYIEYFWESKSHHFKDCQTDDLQFVFKKHSELTNNVVLNIIK
jgi:hypothetical protein